MVSPQKGAQVGSGEDKHCPRSKRPLTFWLTLSELTPKAPCLPMDKLMDPQPLEPETTWQ